MHAIPRWVFAGAAAGLLALAAIVLGSDNVLAGVPYRRTAPSPTVTLVVGLDGGFGVLDGLEVKADSFQTHTPNAVLNVGTGGTGDVEIGNSTSGSVTLTNGDATFSGNVEAVVVSGVLLQGDSIVSNGTLQTLFGQINAGGFLNMASGTHVNILATCDARGNSTFPQTCDQMAGFSTVGGTAGVTPFVINNALVASDLAICHAHLTEMHAGCSSIYCVATTGVLTFQTNANCLLSAQNFNWVLESGG